MAIEPTITEAFQQSAQDHIFKYFDGLTAAQKECFLQEVSQINPQQVSELYNSLVIKGKGLPFNLKEIKPVQAISLPRDESDLAYWGDAHYAGEEALKSGRVAAFTVAGGQGTRLGFDGPKGMFPVTPVTQKSLFQVFAEKLKAAIKRYGQSIHWFIMTSEINHEQTIRFFDQKKFFGLNKDEVHFFQQGLMPAVDFQGKIILSNKGSLALSPDGHGGSFRALLNSGAIDRMESLGVDVISYFQVDNPLVRCIDPAFIGFHLLNDSEMSSKTVRKATPAEKLGCFCKTSGKLAIVEYSDMPQELANLKDLNGHLSFGLGNIAVHIIQRDFAKKIGSGLGEYALPFHVAKKKVQMLDESGKIVRPCEPNGYKFEQFIFDALSFAKNPILLEANRSEEFSPVKNAKGNDSPETSRRDQMRLHSKWIQSTGFHLHANNSDLEVYDIEIGPLFADTQSDFVKKWKALPRKPDLNDKIYLG